MKNDKRGLWGGRPLAAAKGSVDYIPTELLSKGNFG
jgi:hypothetical protein